MMRDAMSALRARLRGARRHLSAEAASPRLRWWSGMHPMSRGGMEEAKEQEEEAAVHWRG